MVGEVVGIDKSFGMWAEKSEGGVRVGGWRDGDDGEG
jgi:hypothetical protein